LSGGQRLLKFFGWHTARKLGLKREAVLLPKLQMDEVDRLEQKRAAKK
jgi:hypothetical protein